MIASSLQREISIKGYTNADLISDILSFYMEFVDIINYSSQLLVIEKTLLAHIRLKHHQERGNQDLTVFV